MIALRREVRAFARESEELLSLVAQGAHLSEDEVQMLRYYLEELPDKLRPFFSV